VPGQAGRAIGNEYRDVDVSGHEAGDRDERRAAAARAAALPDPAAFPAPAPAPAGAGAGAGDLTALLARVARGDEAAFRMIFDQTAGPVLGTVRRIVRDPAQSEEVMQEVLLEVWRTAARFDPEVGSPTAWIMMLAHRRAVDRVRSEHSAARRELRAAVASVEYDEVAEAVELNLDHERVRRCLSSLTELQREAVTLAYYHGNTYREVAELLGISVGTVKTRMRDGLIRLRDCLGVD
jgi:RNA polymerase sigma-70 factor, ECF subfamily